APVVADAMGDRRGEIHQAANGGIGAGVGALFDDLSEQDHGGDKGGGLEVERGSVSRPECSGELFAPKEGGGAVNVGGTGAGHREGEHVGIEFADRLPPAAEEEPAAPEKDRGGESELYPARGRVA